MLFRSERGGERKESDRARKVRDRERKETDREGREILITALSLFSLKLEEPSCRISVIFMESQNFRQMRADYVLMTEPPIRTC